MRKIPESDPSRAAGWTLVPAEGARLPPESETASRVRYYGTRYYSPSQGRFINRDSIEEQGGLNLYAFCSNNGVNSFDVLGRDAFMDIGNRINPNGTVSWDQGDLLSAYDKYLDSRPTYAEGVEPDSNNSDSFGGDRSRWGVWNVVSDLQAKGYDASIRTDGNGHGTLVVPIPGAMVVSAPRVTSAPNSLAREGGAGTGSLPMLSQSQIDGVWNAWGEHVKLNSPRASDSAAVKEAFAQAVLYRRPDGSPAIAMQQVVQGILSPGNDGRMISIGFGVGNNTMPINGGIISISIERSNQAQIVVSIMHELLHAVDYQTLRGLDSLLISSNARHDEIYRLQNQTLYELTGTVDRSYGTHTIPNPTQFVDPKP